VVCSATDPDGDPMVYDWYRYGPLITRSGAIVQYTRDNSIVVFVHASAAPPLDTGWIACRVRDDRGGGRDAGLVPIIIRH